MSKRSRRSFLQLFGLGVAAAPSVLTALAKAESLHADLVDGQHASSFDPRQLVPTSQPVLTAMGSDTNIPLILLYPKGSGMITFHTGGRTQMIVR